ADVDRLDDLAPGQALRALEAVGDVHEAAGLVAVAPDLDLVAAGELGLDHLAAHRRRCLLAAALEGAVGAVNVVVAGDARLKPEVLAEVAAHPLAEQLLPAVAVLGHGRIRV